MAYAGQPVAEGAKLVMSYKASGAIAAGVPVKFLSTDTTGKTVEQCDTAGEKACGIALQALTSAQATAGRHVDVMHSGLVWAVASAAITLDSDITPAVTTGKCKSTTTSTHRLLGRAFSAASAANDLFLLAVQCLNLARY